MGTLGENDSGVLLPLFEGELDELRQQLGFSLSSKYWVQFSRASLTLVHQRTTRSSSSMLHSSFGVITS